MGVESWSEATVEERERAVGRASDWEVGCCAYSNPDYVEDAVYRRLKSPRRDPSTMPGTTPTDGPESPRK